MHINLALANSCYLQFVRVHQQLLATVIGKHGIFAQFGVTAPIAAILQSLEAAIDVCSRKPPLLPFF
jgi:hypothetical protein